MNTQEYRQRMKNIFGDRLDFSQCEYVSMRTPFTAICPAHGKITKKAYQFGNGRGCPKCHKNAVLSQEKFIGKCVARYGDKYKYTYTVYTNMRTSVLIECREHGLFVKLAGDFIVRGRECPKCVRNKPRKKHKKRNLAEISKGLVTPETWQPTGTNPENPENFSDNT